MNIKTLLNFDYLALQEAIKTNALELLKAVKTEAENGCINTDELKFDVMNVLTEVYYYIWGEDEILYYYDRLLVNPYLFEAEEAAEGLGIKEEELKHCYYIETYFDGFVPVGIDFIISFIDYLTDALKGEYINGRLSKVIGGVRYVILTAEEWAEYPNEYKTEENGVKKGLFNGVKGTALIPVLIEK